MCKSAKLEKFEKARDYILINNEVTLNLFAEYMGIPCVSSSQLLNLVCARYSIDIQPLGYDDFKKKGVYKVN